MDGIITLPHLRTLLGLRVRHLGEVCVVIEVLDDPPSLVLQADGQVLPLTHELPPSLWLGSVHEAPLKALAARWLHSRASQRLVQALERTWTELAAGAQPAAYWYDEVAARAQAQPVPVPVHVAGPQRAVLRRSDAVAAGARA